MFNAKKKFFKRKIKAVTCQIWDLEFKVEKSLQVREGVRQDRDRMNDAKNKVEAALKAKPKDEALLKEFEGIVDTIKRYELQMKMIDNEINGVKAEGENPGQNGIMETIDSLAELRRMLKDYVAKI